MTTNNTDRPMSGSRCSQRPAARLAIAALSLFMFGRGVVQIFDAVSPERRDDDLSEVEALITAHELADPVPSGTGEDLECLLSELPTSEVTDDQEFARDLLECYSTPGLEP